MEQAITTLVQLSEKNIELECSAKMFSFSSKAWTDKKLQNIKFLIFEAVLYCFDFWSQLKESYFKKKKSDDSFCRRFSLLLIDGADQFLLIV